MIIIADLGATNARFCVTKDCLTYSNKANYQINDFDSVEELCFTYLQDKGLKNVKMAVIGVAAPILEDKVSFVNNNLEFSIKNLEKKIFSGGLIVVNDLELQAYALFNLKDGDLSYIGQKNLTHGPKILVAPGTGLGLAGILGENVIATEAGHINISDKEMRSDLKVVMDRFAKENHRAPTYEDFLSGKGITYFYKAFSGESNTKLSSEEILLARRDDYSLKTIEVLHYLLSSYLRYMALVWGAHGGVLLSGSIVNSLLLEEDYQEFRDTFEDSETMRDFMRAVPLAIVLIEEIGYVGGLELSKKLK